MTSPKLTVRWLDHTAVVRLPVSPRATAILMRVVVERVPCVDRSVTKSGPRPPAGIYPVGTYAAQPLNRISRCTPARIDKAAADSHTVRASSDRALGECEFVLGQTVIYDIGVVSENGVKPIQRLMVSDCCCS